LLVAMPIWIYKCKKDWQASLLSRLSYILNDIVAMLTWIYKCKWEAGIPLSDTENAPSRSVSISKACACGQVYICMI
jgi:hypothetical protein